MPDAQDRLNQAKEAIPCSDAIKGGAGNTNLGLQTVGEFMLRQRPADNWVVDGLLPYSGTSLVVAAPKDGKSTFARNACVRVAGGGWYLGRECTQFPTLYCLFEGRWQGAQQHFQDMETDAKAPVHVFYGPAPDDPWKWLASAIGATGARLVVLDTVGRFLRTDDLNSYSEVTKATEPWIMLASNTGAHIMGLHHRRKSGGAGGEEASGSAALFAAVDTGIFFKLDGDRRSIYTRQREGDDMEETALRLDAKGWNHLGATARDNRRDELETDIADTLAEHDTPMRDREIAKNVRKRKEAVLAALNRMVERGTVLRMGAGNRGDSFRYGLQS